MDTYKNGKEILSIHRACIETIPCMHHCEHNGIKKLYSSPVIIAWFKKNSIKVPDHFEYESLYYSQEKSCWKCC